MNDTDRQHLDALMGSFQDELDKAHEWETHYHEHHDEIHLAYFKGRTDALEQCLDALNRRIESASLEPWSAELPAVRSTAWLDALMDDWVRREGSLRLKGHDQGRYDMHERRYFNSQAELMKTLRAEVQGA